MIEVITCQYMSLLHHPDHAVVSILPACLLLLESQGDTDWVGQVIRQQEDGLLPTHCDWSVSVSQGPKF